MTFVSSLRDPLPLARTTCFGVLVVPLLALYCLPAVAQEVEEELRLDRGNEQIIEGQIDWTNNEIVAYGEGVAPENLTDPVRRRLMGFRAAKTVAYRNLLELVGEVQIDAETQVRMAMVENDSVRIRLEGIVRGARVVPGSQKEVEGLYRIALRLELLREFSETVLPAANAVDPEAEVVDEIDSDSLLTYIPESYDGLIVDARGMDLRPSMAPKILALSGAQVYGVGMAERHFVTSMGLVGYYKDLEQAAASDRLGGLDAHPLVVKAQQVSGLYNADVVVSNEDAANIRFADSSADFLKECRVALLLGPSPVDMVRADSVLTDSINLEDLDFDFPEEAEDRDGQE